MFFIPGKFKAKEKAEAEEEKKWIYRLKKFIRIQNI